MNALAGPRWPKYNATPKRVVLAVTAVMPLPVNDFQNFSKPPPAIPAQQKESAHTDYL
jgi:hypothetical protein